MSPSRCISPLLLLAAAGCLQAGKEPEGIKLAPGRDIGSIGFTTLNGRAWVAFNRIKSPATPSKGSVSDLWIAGPMGNSPDAGVDGAADEVDGGVQAEPQQRLVIADRSDRWGSTVANGSLFTMVKERVSGGETVGTLVRIDSSFQPQETFENISTFAVGSDKRLLYRQVPVDNQTPGLFLWDGQDSLRLGDVASASLLDTQITGSGMAYFVLGSDQVLSRLGKLTDTKQDLHANVSRFLLSNDEKYATLSLLNVGTSTTTSTTVVLDVQAGKDLPLARPNPCCWLGFSPPERPNLFTYAQSASAAAPAEYHTLDLVSGVDTTLVLPAPLVDMVSSMDRNSDESLYRDSVFFGLSDHKARRTVMRVDPATGQVVPARMLNPKFSPDGRYLLYIDPQPRTVAEPDPHGPLLVQDVAFVDQPVEHPPRQLSTPGMSVQASTDYRFIAGPTTDAGPSVVLFFWANIVRSSSDLYFANHETGELIVAASAIGSVTVIDYKRVFGTLNVSAQDGTGELVDHYVDLPDPRVLAHAVTGFALGGDPNPTPQTKGGLVAYVVRGRVPSDHDGLWGTPMPPPPGQDGGQ